MLMTEEQARTKWCPKARQTDGDHPTYNRMEDGSAPESCLCIASGCMAWRKENVFERNGMVRDAEERRIGVGNTGRGYCGAFGKAEG